MSNFNKLMFETLDETMRMVLGDNFSQFIYSFIQTQPALKVVGNKNEAIITYLEKTLGKEITKIIQAITIKRLYLKLKREYEEVENHFIFLDELYEMKFMLLISSSKNRSSACN